MTDGLGAMPETDLNKVLAEFRPGLEVYLQGAGGEPLALRPILQGAPEALAGVRLTSCLIPGINDFDYAALHPDARLTVFMLPPALRASFEARRVTVRPMAYSHIAELMSAGPPADLAILQVTPPDAAGLCSFGPCVDFAPLVWPRAKRRLAFVNAALPRPHRGATIPFEALDVTIDAEGPFITGRDAPPSPAQDEIAQRVAALVPDGASIQTGLGGAPAAAVAKLARHRRLVIRSGMVTEGYRVLAESGALDPGADHITGLAYGSAAFMAWAAERWMFADASNTHGAAALAATPYFFAINSALEVDLFGQVNVEWRGGRLVSGTGGAPDFARAARLSPGGRAILAVPASAGPISRIVPRLETPTVSLPGSDADLVVTEHGVADMRDASLDARAEALIAIAAPEHRLRLAEAWTRMRREF